MEGTGVPSYEFEDPLNILFASSEVAPFAKTGGLADVCGALPVELTRLGHNVAVVMPLYRQVKNSGHAMEPLNLKFDIPMGNKIIRGRLLRGNLPGSNVPVFFVEQDDYFDRDDLYRHKGEDYKDNCERFVFFSRAVLESIRMLKLAVDVVHCHDWQTGLIPALLQIEYPHAQGYENVASLTTIHNLAYQGLFWHWDMLVTGLDWKYFNMHQMEFYGKLNLLKTGLVFADGISTVSERYAHEIQTPELGCGLEGVLLRRADVLEGIVNGVDYEVWNPATDKHLLIHYDVTTWQQGKAANKAALQAELGLPQSPETPLLGLVGRLADQKGWDLVAEVMGRWVRETDAQWVILGTGEPHYHELLGRLGREAPHRVAARLQFSEQLAHRIEAASDMFLMPSQYEPCGLNQLYSLRYGTVPVVRSVGGLADTVTQATEENIARGSATGFAFDDYSYQALEGALGSAVATYHHRKDVWQKLVETGMQQDWSWRKSAEKYVALYKRVHQRHAEARAKLMAGK
jgi:starch synthase